MLTLNGFSSMSFLVAVRPASALTLKKPFFSSRARARASLVVSLGTATLILSSFLTTSEEAAAEEAVLLAVEEEPPQAVRAAAAAAMPVTFRKSRREILDIMFSLSCCSRIFLHCAAHFSAPCAAGSTKKAPPSSAGNCPQGRKRIKLPWYHLGSPRPHGPGLDAAAAAFSSHCLQPDAVTGAPVAGLALLHFAPAAPRPFSVPCSLPFSTDRALWKDQCENLLFSSQPFL